MFRVKDLTKLEEMGFVKNEETGDYVIAKTIKNIKRTIFRIYRGSDYIRYSKTVYVLEEHLKLIYDWTKKDLIYWEEF